MTPISSVGSSWATPPLAGVGASTAPPAQPAPDADVSLQTRIDAGSTQLTLGGRVADDSTYPNPALATSLSGTRMRAWEVLPQDDISRLMARNEEANGGDLSTPWRGLGGALLTRLLTTQSDYRQTVVDYESRLTNMVVDQAAGISYWNVGMGETVTSRSQALSAVQNGETQVNLSIQTRSGKTVQLVIGVNSLNPAVGRGLHAEIKTSGPLSQREATAIAQLAEGLNKTLEGLGGQQKVALDVAGLVGYDRSVLSGLDMRVRSSGRGMALQSFELHANASRSTVSLQSWAGKMSLTVDGSSALGVGSSDQRQDAIQSYLKQFDAVGQRSRADADLLGQFKSAFAQLHAAQADAAPGGQAAALVSGLADFRGGFGGEFAHQGPEGTTTAAGTMQYEVAQTTRVVGSNPADAASITQTQTSKLTADYRQTRGGAMLMVDQGNYDRYQIRDEKLSTLKIEIAKDLVQSAVQSTVDQQFLHFESLVDHRVAEQRDTPSVQRSSRNLLHR